MCLSGHCPFLPSEFMNILVIKLILENVFDLFRKVMDQISSAIAEVKLDKAMYKY